jgi:hypothetical protein
MQNIDSSVPVAGLNLVSGSGRHHKQGKHRLREHA